MKNPSMKDMAKITGLAPTKVAMPPLELPEGPYVVRDAKGRVLSFTEAGLQAISYMARCAVSQEAIGLELGILAGTFHDLLGRARANPPSPARLAWEQGHHARKSDLWRVIHAQALAGNYVCGFFELKGEFDVRDQGPQTAIQINNNPAAPRIEIIPAGSSAAESERICREAAEDGRIALPGSFSRAESMARQHQVFVFDSRDSKRIIESMRDRGGKSDEEIAAYLHEQGHDRDARELLNDPNRTWPPYQPDADQLAAWRKLAAEGDTWCCEQLATLNGGGRKQIEHRLNPADDTMIDVSPRVEDTPPLQPLMSEAQQRADTLKKISEQTAAENLRRVQSGEPPVKVTAPRVNMSALPTFRR